MFASVLQGSGINKENNDDLDDNLTVDKQYQHLKLPILLSLRINNWFDPIFLQKRIERLMQFNDVGSEVGSISNGTIAINEQGRE